MAQTRPTSPDPTGTSPRHAGIEAARLALCLAVVLLHALPDPVPPAMVPVAAACRIAVPFFFIAGGFFLRVPDRWTWSILRRPGKVAGLYAAWLVLYLLFFWVHGPPWRPHGIDVLTGGAAFHLWFLPALAVSMALVASGFALGRPGLTLAVAVALAAASLALGSDHQALGLPLFRGTRFLGAPLFLCIGVILARRGARLPLGAALVLLLVAYGLELGEERLIARLSAAPFASHDVVLSTYLLGVATFLVARALPPTRAIRWAAGGGRVSLGVYAVHLAILLLVLPLAGGSGLLHALAAAGATFALATILCLGFARIPVLWALVTTQKPKASTRRG